MTIVVTGGSGFIGTELTRVLLAKGHTVIVIDKKGPSLTHQNLFYIPCDLQRSTLPFNVLERTDAIIHLAGKGIVGRWTEKNKQEIRDSRVLSTTHIVESLSQTTNKPSIFISASAVGYYGEGGENELDEHAPKGDTFLSTVVADWEAEAMKAEQFGSRVVIVRTAPVLGKGGALAPLWSTARFHFTTKVSKKDFFFPWIHINDIVRVYLFALETNTLQGVVNAASPTHLRYRDFMKSFNRVTRSISLGVLPFSKFLFKELQQEMTLSQKVVPRRLTDKGFAFAFTDIEEALRAIQHEKN